MAVVATERFESRETGRGPNAQSVLYYSVTGTDDDDEALTQLQSTAPATWDGKPVQNWNVRPLGPSLWLGIVTYALSNFNDTNTNVFSFDTGGGTQHITLPVSGTSITKYGGSAPDRSIIGWDGTNAQGCDIVVPVYNWTDTYYKDDGDVDAAYKSTLYGLTGKVNSDSWKGYAAGEVLFLGASGAKRGWYGDWEISFRFAASPNQTGLSFGSISGVAKKGWEYLWEEHNKDTGALVGVYVAQVYPTGAFSALGL